MFLQLPLQYVSETEIDDQRFGAFATWAHLCLSNYISVWWNDPSAFMGNQFETQVMSPGDANEVPNVTGITWH